MLQSTARLPHHTTSKARVKGKLDAKREKGRVEGSAGAGVDCPGVQASSFRTQVYRLSLDLPGGLLNCCVFNRMLSIIYCTFVAVLAQFAGGATAVKVLHEAGSAQEEQGRG